MWAVMTPKNSQCMEAFPKQLGTPLFTVFRISVSTVLYLMQSKIIWCTEYLAILQSQTTAYCVMLLEEAPVFTCQSLALSSSTGRGSDVQIPWNLCTADPELKLPRISSQYIEHLLVPNWNFESKLPTKYPCYFIDPVWLFVMYSNIAIYCI